MGVGTTRLGLHPPQVSDCIDIFGNGQLSATFNATANCIANMAEGIYDIWATADCYILDGANATVANGVLSNTGYLLRGNNTISILIRGNHCLGAIQSTTSGTLAAVKVG